jgi:bifunctional non-homologous end joining protein LigD
MSVNSGIAALKAVLLKNPPPGIRYSASFTQNIDQLLTKVRELSMEGLIGKRAGSKYDSKRTGVWVKIKLYQQSSFVIGGYTQPGGERKHLGALLVGAYCMANLNLLAGSEPVSAKNS